jgi:lysophospholipase L1-like esterase
MRLSFYIIVMSAVLLSAATQRSKPLTVYLIGDSTIANKLTTAYPEHGWGMPFKHFFDSSVTVDNRAKNGRSTRTFISENLWQPIADNLKEGDYVFIQFGHNDESKEKVDRYTRPEAYKENLVKFIQQSRERKAIPILLTPVSRRKFVDGKVTETHAAYTPLVFQVGQTQNVPVIDLDAKSRELYQSLGEEHSRLLFVHLKPGEHPNYPDGKEDNTHFNELGARKIAQLVLAEIKALKLELADRVVKPVKK